jgi:hypothetical protein
MASGRTKSASETTETNTFVGKRWLMRTAPPSHKDHVWSYDFVADRTSDGRAFRMLPLIDEHTRECLAIDVARRLKSEDVLERLSDLLVRRGAAKPSGLASCPLWTGCRRTGYNKLTQ